jgi:hypothetical protein
MKNIIATALFIIAAITLHAQQVNFNIASKLAANFMDARANNKVYVQESDSYTFSDAGLPVYHVVNFYPQGFVIVAADDRLSPVLAYSFNSSCPENGQNPAFYWWMQRYVNEINQVRSANIPASSSISELWADYLNADIPQPKVQLEPLLTSTWDQGTYYNEFCPADIAGPDGKCVTGCVATAIGQLMNYFRWPQNGLGSYTSEDTVYGTLTVDYGAAEYLFNEMAVNVNRSNPETAELIYNIGVSVDMHYGPSGSGMNNHKAAHTMKTFFRYLDSTQYIFRDSVSIDWDSVMVAHLDQKLPMYYAGWSDTNYVSGHAFVCDGYQDTAFFHFNWGWGGSYDGFFNVDNLSPGGANFTLMHELVINMYPEGTYPYYCNGADTVHSLDGTIDDGSGPLFEYQNNTNCSWLIAPNDSIQKIELEFLRFNTEMGNDIVTIYDGPDALSPVLGTFSGSTLPTALESTGDKVFIVFQSDAANTSDGFLLTYSAVKYSYCSSLLTLTADADTITDGSGSFDYNGNVFCRWKIEPVSGDPLLLGFTEFDLDSTDYVRVIDHTNSQVLGEYRGNALPPTAYSPNGTLTVYLKTNATAQGDGFKAWYRTSATAINESENGECILFPNPAESYFIVSGVSENIEIRAYDLSGKLLYSLAELVSVDGMIKVDISSWSRGMYVIEVEGEEFLKTFKLVK